METQYSIKAAARMAELTVDTVRAWERRYAAVEPDRSGNGRRVYTNAEVERLSLLKQATDLGHTISMVASLEDDDLRSLIRRGRVAQEKSGEGAIIVSRLIGFVQANAFLDFERELGKAAIALAPRDLIDDVIFPLLQEVGNRWYEGSLSIAQEHAVSSNLRSLIGAMIRIFPQSSSGPSILFATLPGERHEFGILLLALLAASRGIRCHYLGPDLPVEEIARSVFVANAQVVALSIVHQGDAAHDIRELRRLHEKVGQYASIWVGGAAASRLREEINDLPIQFMNSVDEFERRAAALQVESVKPGGTR